MTVKMLVATLLATGCVTNGAGGTPDGGAAPDGGQSAAAFTQAEATLAGKALAADIEGAARRYGAVAPSLARAVSCVAMSGDATDTDGDSIPAGATLTFDCSEQRLGYTGTLTGTESVSDTQPDALAWAFSVTSDLHAELTGPFGGSMVVDGDGSITASQGSLAGPFRLASTLGVVSVITNVRGIETDIAEELDSTLSYAPDLEWTPGGVVVTGALTADGAWTVSVGEKSADASLSTPTTLTFTPSCESRVTAGVVEASLAFGARAASIRVEWSGCGRPTVTYDVDAAP